MTFKYSSVEGWLGYIRRGTIFPSMIGYGSIVAVKMSV